MIREYRDKKKGNFYQSMMAGFAVLMGVAVWVLGGAYKAEKLLANVVSSGKFDRRY